MSDEQRIMTIKPSSAKVACGNCGQVFEDVREITGHRCSFEPLKKRMDDMQSQIDALHAKIEAMIEAMQAGK